jgi:mRNA-degrading endonuclease toxin of MazEF toxin-antitoxin module
MWWIPDSQTPFGSRDRHPWVVIGPFTPNQPTVMVCPRTSQLEPPRGMFTPAYVIEGLDRPGMFLYKQWRTMSASDFRDFDYIGRLPEAWRTQLCEYVRASRGKGRATR